MERKEIKEPEYDGNACMLYDYMIHQGLTEKMIMLRMGIYTGHPHMPVSYWIQHSDSIPYYRIPALCAVLNAPMHVIYAKSCILNGLPFHMCASVEHIARKPNLSDIPSDDLIEEVKHRGYKVYREV